MELRAIFAVQLLLTASFAATPAHGGCLQYEVQIIQAPSCGILGPPLTIGLAISEAGTVCGYRSACNSYRRAFLWAPETGLFTMPMPSGSTSTSQAWAHDLNSAGVTVGVIDSLVTHHRGFTFVDGKFTVLSALPGATQSEAYSISEANQPVIVGYSFDTLDGDPFSAVRWINGTIEPLNLPTTGWSYAYDVNDNGQICGSMAEKPFHDHAFVWTNRKAIDLGVIPGGQSSEALAINNHGDVCGSGVVGFDANQDAIYQAMVYIDGKMQNIGVLPGYPRCHATDINDAGQVVGYCDIVCPCPPDLPRPGFIWQNGVMRSLADFVGPPPNISMDQVHAINNRGQIVARGKDSANPSTPLTILLTPVRHKPGDTDCNGHVGILDLLDAIGQWGPSIPGTTADFDNNGVVNIHDLLILITNWD